MCASDPQGSSASILVTCLLRTARRSRHYVRMFTARAMTSAVVERAIALCTAMRPFAHRGMGIVSVGENAVACKRPSCRSPEQRTAALRYPARGWPRRTERS
jgi:hypothetical protein